MSKGIENLSRTIVKEKFYQGNVSFIEKYANSSEENLEFSLTEGFRSAVDSGKIAPVKFLLLSDKIARNADVHYDEEKPFMCACQDNQLYVVKYLIENFPVDINQTYTLTGGNAFMYACRWGELKLIDFLAQKIKPQCIYQIDSYGKDAFIRACENEKYGLDIIKYMLLEMNLKPQSHHMQYLDSHSSTTTACALELLKRKDFKNELENTLIEKNSKNITIKKI